MKHKLRPMRHKLGLGLAFWIVIVIVMLPAISRPAAVTEGQAMDQAAIKSVIQFQGILQDTTFPPPTAVRLEILESGDTLTVVPGTAFTVNLPSDTIWNLCFSAPSGLSSPSTPGGAEISGRREKCYEIKYVGGDSSFSAKVGEGMPVLDQLPDTGTVTTFVSADSGATDTASGALRSEDALQLKKVLVRA